MAVAPGASESNFGKSILVPIIFSAPLSLHFVIAEVPTIFDFEENDPPSCHSTPTTILLNHEINDIAYLAFLVALLRNSHICAPAIA